MRPQAEWGVYDLIGLYLRSLEWLQRCYESSEAYVGRPRRTDRTIAYTYNCAEAHALLRRCYCQIIDQRTAYHWRVKSGVAVRAWGDPTGGSPMAYS